MMGAIPINIYLIKNPKTFSINFSEEKRTFTQIYEDDERLFIGMVD